MVNAINATSYLEDRHNINIADAIFVNCCREIINHGYFTDGEVRPKWPDGTPAPTIHITNVVNVYRDVANNFPLMSLRRTGIKSAIDEILWIYQKKSNNIHDLNSHIWDSWADETGSIGKAYGYQIGQLFLHHKVKSDVALEAMLTPTDDPFRTINNYPSLTYLYKDEYTEVWMDQMDAVLWDLRNNRNSRRILTNTFNHHDLHEMGLQPCAYSTTWTVLNGKLNLLLNQRSQDMLAASNWNVCQYAALLIMVAKATGLVPGDLTHVIADCHIYDRHIPIIEELIDRPSFSSPKVTFVNESTNFYDYKPEDFVVEGYHYGEQVKFEVAI